MTILSNGIEVSDFEVRLPIGAGRFSSSTPDAKPSFRSWHANAIAVIGAVGMTAGALLGLSAAPGQLWLANNGHLVLDPSTEIVEAFLVQADANEIHHVVYDQSSTPVLAQRPHAEVKKPHSIGLDPMANRDFEIAAPAIRNSATPEDNLSEIYRAQIAARIERSIEESRVEVPADCMVIVDQRRDGMATKLSLENCGSDPENLRQLAAAVQRAEPFPAPPRSDLFVRTLIVRLSGRVAVKLMVSGGKT